MFRKLLPFAAVLFLAACAGTGITTHSTCSHCPKQCCEHCEDCKNCECGCDDNKVDEKPCKICMESKRKNQLNN